MTCKTCIIPWKSKNLRFKNIKGTSKIIVIKGEDLHPIFCRSFYLIQPSIAQVFDIAKIGCAKF